MREKEDRRRETGEREKKREKGREKTRERERGRERRERANIVMLNNFVIASLQHSCEM